MFKDTKVLQSRKGDIRVLFEKFQEHAVSEEEVLTSEPLRAVKSEVERLSSILSEKSRTGKLWIEYFKQVKHVYVWTYSGPQKWRCMLP